MAEIAVSELARLELTPMGQAAAERIAAWSYPGEYAFYDFAADPDDLAELLDPEQRRGRYFAATLPRRGLIGFVELKEPDGGSLELGLGLSPECAGRGLGVAFVTRLCRWVAERTPAEVLVLQVADFNRRAITVYERAGFRHAAAHDVDLYGRTVRFLELRRAVGDQPPGWTV